MKYVGLYKEMRNAENGLDREHGHMIRLEREEEMLKLRTRFILEKRYCRLVEVLPELRNVYKEILCYFLFIC